MFGNIRILKLSDTTCQVLLFSPLFLETDLSSVITVTNHWVQGYAWQICICRVFINNKACCFLLCGVFSFFPLVLFWKTASKMICFLLDILSDMSHLTASQHVGSNRQMSSSTAQTCDDRMTCFNIPFGKCEKGSNLWSNRRTLLFQETITFMQPYLCSWKRWGRNVAIRTFWKVQEVPTLAISFPFFIPSLVYSLTPHFVILYLFCNAFYSWNCHTSVFFLKKRPHNDDIRQTVTVNADIRCTKAATSVNPGHRRPGTNVQNDFHGLKVAGWILCTDKNTSMAKLKMERRRPMSDKCKMSDMQRTLNCARDSSEVELPFELSHISGSGGWTSGCFELTWVSSRGERKCSTAASCLNSHQLLPEVYPSLITSDCFLQFLQEFSVGRKTVGFAALETK